MGSRAKPFLACGLLQFLICDVRDIGSASDDRIDAVGVDVNSRNIESGLTERQRERQAYVAQADDAESGRFGFDPVFKLDISFAFDIDISLNDCAHYECSSIRSLILLLAEEGNTSSFNSHALCQIARLIDVTTTQHGYVISEQLKRDRR